MPTSTITGKKSLQTEILPQTLTQALEALHLKGVVRATSIQICSRILGLQHRHKLTPEDYVQVASTYLLKIDPKYSRALNVLKTANIVQLYQHPGGRTYSTAGHQAKAYRVNPDLVDTQVAEVHYEIKQFKTRNLSAQEEQWLLQDLQSLRIDTVAAQKELTEHLEYLDLREWEVTAGSYEYQQNQQLTTVRFGTHASEYKYKAQYVLDTLLEQDEHQGKKLYRNGAYYCIDTPKAFKRRKVESIRKRYGQAINALQKQLFYATRSAGNDRVNHTITETPNFLLDYITFDGEDWEELDVSNSQMAALAHVMLHGDVLGDAGIDFPSLELTGQSRAFLEACHVGTINQDFAKHIQASRAVAKTELFRVCFGGIQTNLPAWKTLATHYAPVANWLQVVKSTIPADPEYREVKDKKTGEVTRKPLAFNLARYLQRVEAWVMMRNVYPALKTAGITALSKHDSFLVPQSDFNEAMAITEATFKHLGYKAKVKYKYVEPQTKATTAFEQLMSSGSTESDESFFALLDSITPTATDSLW